MSTILVDKRFRELIKQHGVAHTARILGKRYATVRKAVSDAGINIKRGRRADAKIAKRNKEIRSVRKASGKFLHEIGKMHNIGRERVRQILEETGGDPQK